MNECPSFLERVKKNILRRRNDRLADSQRGTTNDQILRSRHSALLFVGSCGPSGGSRMACRVPLLGVLTICGGQMRAFKQCIPAVHGAACGSHRARAPLLKKRAIPLEAVQSCPRRESNTTCTQHHSDNRNSSTYRLCE